MKSSLFGVRSVYAAFEIINIANIGLFTDMIKGILIRYSSEQQNAGKDSEQQKTRAGGVYYFA